MARVHYLTTAYPGVRAGVVHIGRMANALAHVGADTHLVRVRTRETARSELSDFLDAGVSVTTLRTGWPWAERLPRVFSVATLTRYAAYLRKLARYRPPDVILTRNLRLGGLAIRCLQGTSPVVIEVHQVADVSQLPRLSPRDLVVAISEPVVKALLARGLPSDRIILAPDAVDLASYRNADGRADEIRSRLGVTGCYVIGYTGHLYPDRGIETLLAAIRVLPQKTALLLVGGTDHDQARISGEIDRLQLGNRVHLIGRVPPSEVPYYQLASDVLVASYSSTLKTKHEASPLKLYEYLAAQRPVIVSSLPFVRDIVDEQSAVLVPPDDPSALAQAFTNLRNDPAASGELAARGVALVAENTWERRARRILDACASLSARVQEPAPDVGTSAS